MRWPDPSAALRMTRGTGCGLRVAIATACVENPRQCRGLTGIEAKGDGCNLRFAICDLLLPFSVPSVANLIFNNQSYLTNNQLLRRPSCQPPMLAGPPHQMTQACYFVRGKCNYTLLVKNRKI